MSQSSNRDSRAHKGLTRTTLAGLIWTLSGSGFQAVLNVVVMAVMARLLTPGDYGLVGAAMIVVSFSTIYSQLGVGPTLVQRAELLKEHIKTAMTITLLLGFSSMAILYVSAPLLATFFKNDQLILVLRVFSPIFVFSSISVIPESLLTRDLKFQQLALVKLISYALGYGVCGVLLGFLGAGYWALVAANFAQAVLMTVMLTAIQPYPKIPGIDRAAFGELFRFATGVTLARTANYLALQGDTVVVGRWLGIDSLGVYGRAYQLMASPAKLFSLAANKVIFSSLAKVQNDPQRLGSAFRRGMGLTALLVLPVSVMVIPLGTEIVQVLLGSQWSGVVAPFQILAVGMFFRTSYQLGGSLMRAKGAVYVLAWFQVVYAILVIGGSLAALQFGLLGVSCGTLAALTVHFTLTTHYGLRLSELKWRDLVGSFIPAFRLSFLFGLLTWGVVWGLRTVNCQAYIILLIAATVNGLCFLLLYRISPEKAIGGDGQWLVHSFFGKKSKASTPVNG